ncbi:hypothetical protein [Paenibacillus piri]|uniref:Uncharacterized protein n=1 Tax=Paenibacillus piri TaxID=2547395 RepID=A0A4R5K9M1_9BACL|nr:hypothetical protein [Paenibacillus piri]TDF91128.1 hypothetical protein E1757_33385 [Paenibacillus piri]
MATRITVCFAPGKALTRDGAQYFGNEIAEPAIIRDYLTQTHGSILGDKERDWWDESPFNNPSERVNNHLAILQKRHRLNAAKLAALRKSPIPDILTYQGIDRDKLENMALFRLTSRLTGLPGISVLIPQKGNRHEYYEIKPRNSQGQSDGRDKIDAVRENYANAGLPYTAGRTYPDAFYLNGVAHIPLLMRSKKHRDQWQSAVKVAMVRENIGRIELYLEVSRKGVLNGGRMPHGLLLYQICAAIEVEKDKTDAVAVRIARDLVHSWTVVATAELTEEIRTSIREAFLSFEPVAMKRGDAPEYEPKTPPMLYTPRFPLIELTFKEIWPTLRGTKDAMREAMISRGIGLPGEEYLVCCDESFFGMLASDAVPAIHLITTVTQAPLRWYGYVKDRGALGVQEIIIEANSFLSQAKALAYDAFTDLVKWGNDNPGKRTVIVLVVLVVAAATIYVAAPLVAAELGIGAVAAEETTVILGSRVIANETSRQGLRMAMQQDIMREALLDEAAESVLQRAVVRETVNATVRATAAPRGVAAADATRQALFSQAGTQLGKKATEEFLKKAGPAIMAGGIGITIGASGRVAYAAEKAMPLGSEPKESPIGLQIGRMFLLRADAEPPPPPAWLAGAPQPAKLKIGMEFDAANHSKEAAALKSGGSKERKCIYLGRIKLN